MVVGFRHVENRHEGFIDVDGLRRDEGLEGVDERLGSICGALEDLAESTACFAV